MVGTLARTEKCSIASIVRTIVVFLLLSAFYFKSSLTGRGRGGEEGCYEEREGQMKDVSIFFFFFVVVCWYFYLYTRKAVFALSVFFLVFVFEKFGLSFGLFFF